MVLESQKVTFKMFCSLIPYSCLLHDLQSKLLQKPAKTNRLPSVVDPLELLATKKFDFSRQIKKDNNVNFYRKVTFEDSEYVDLIREEQLIALRPKMLKDLPLTDQVS